MLKEILFCSEFNVGIHKTSYVAFCQILSFIRRSYKCMQCDCHAAGYASNGLYEFVCHPPVLNYQPCQSMTRCWHMCKQFNVYSNMWVKLYDFRHTCFTARPAVARSTQAGEHCDFRRGTTSVMRTRMAQTLVDVWKTASAHICKTHAHVFTNNPVR